MEPGAAVKRIIHIVRKNYAGDVINHDYAKVSLPLLPGVTITGDRSDTAPQSRIIRTARCAPRGAALVAIAKQRVEWVRSALIEVSQEIEE